MKPKVLVIDDESSILNTLQILLRGEGFDVEVTQSGFIPKGPSPTASCSGLR